MDENTEAETKPESTDKKKKYPCARMCEVMNYVEYFKEPIMATIKRYSTIKQYAFILHDKDYHINDKGEKEYLEKPHYHIYLRFDGSQRFDYIASWFGIEPQYVNRVKDRKGLLQYLTHSNDSTPNKHHYDSSEIYSNFNVDVEIKNCEILGNFEKYSFAEQLTYVHSLPTDLQISAHTKLKKYWELETQYRSLQADRNIEVIFISGEGGTGKTTFAKDLFRKRKFDFCVSSASNDPFQDYKGQNGLLLDDLRDRTFLYEDFLKVIDNHNSSSLLSRFSNKVFVGKLIIITSSIPLYKWYRGGVHRNGEFIKLTSDDLWQLYRRITCYITITKTDITVYNDGLERTGRPKGVGLVLPNTLSSRFQQAEHPRTDYGTLMRDIVGEYGNVQEGLTPFDIKDN